MSQVGQLIGRQRELTLLLAALAAGRHVLIEGPVGVGKTRLAAEAAVRLGRGVVRVDGDERYSEQKLAGWFDPPAVLASGYGSDSFVPGPLHRAMAEGRVLFINELNRMPEGVQNLLLPALDEGRLEVARLSAREASPGFVVAATQNPREFVGTALISEALRDRFELLVLDYQSFGEEEEIVAQLTGLDAPGLIKRAVFIARATRGHPLVRRGASLRAAASMAAIAVRLGGDEAALEQAAEMALPTRVELKEDLEQEAGPSWGQLLAEVLKKKALAP